MKIAKSLAATAFFLLTFSTQILFAADTKAQILSLTGVVQMKDANGIWKPVALGDVLPVGTELSTVAGGECQIGFLLSQKSAVDVKPGSKVVLDSLNPVRIDIREGKIFTMIKGLKPGSDFIVRTPTAVASARGTGGEHGLDSLLVHDGTFSVEAGGVEKPVSEGMGISFNEEGFGEEFPVTEDSRQEYSGFVSEAATRVDEAAKAVETEVEKPTEDRKDVAPTPPGPPSGESGSQPDDTTVTSSDKLSERVEDVNTADPTVKERAVENEFEPNRFDNFDDLGGEKGDSVTKTDGFDDPGQKLAERIINNDLTTDVKETVRQSTSDDFTFTDSKKGEGGDRGGDGGGYQGGGGGNVVVLGT